MTAGDSRRLKGRQGTVADDGGRPGTVGEYL